MPMFYSVKGHHLFSKSEFILRSEILAGLGDVKRDYQ
jgi:hypothetical protein